MHDGQKPRPLHGKGTRSSSPQCRQAVRTRPWEKSPQTAKPRSAEKAFEAELVALREAKEAGWAERESAVSEREAEHVELLEKKAAHEAALAAAVKKAEDEGTALARRQAKSAYDLLAKENDGKRRVYELRIGTLEETIQKQAAQIEALSKQLSTALRQAQDLAVKAIEGASNSTSFDAIREIAMEQAKHGGKGK